MQFDAARHMILHRETNQCARLHDSHLVDRNQTTNPEVPDIVHPHPEPPELN